jgi:hypothetical protein
VVGVLFQKKLQTKRESKKQTTNGRIDQQHHMDGVGHQAGLIT